MKIAELPESVKVDDATVVIIDTENGTKKMPFNLLREQQAEQGLDDSVIHRITFRGKNLGAKVTSEQWAHIADGTFEDLFVGDYWVISGNNWRIADINYWLQTGSASNCTTPHLLIVPDKGLYTQRFNETNTTEGGYLGSEMYKTGLDAAKATIKAAFGAEHILTHNMIAVNAVQNGIPSGYAWVDTQVDLMTSQMVYGNTVHLPTSTGTSTPASYTVDKTQLALFQISPEFINTRQSYWLRDVVRNGNFAHVHGTQACSGVSTSMTEYNVRPVFGIM